MKIAVTGASGFTGSHLVRELSERGHAVSALVRPSSDLGAIRKHLAETRVCDLSDGDSIAAAIEGCDSMINVVTLGTGLASPLVDAARRAGIRRVVFTSTTGIFTTLNPASKEIRLEAERTIQESSLAYTIIRPTMIYGTPRDRNMWRLITWINRSRFVPVAGAGEHKQQPVHVEDLAWALAEAAEKNTTERKSYNISGGSVLTFNEVVDTIAHHLGRRVWKVRLPLRPMYSSVHAIERLGFRAPIKSEQLLRLNEDKAFPHIEATHDFGYNPRPFYEGARTEVGYLHRV